MQTVHVAPFRVYSSFTLHSNGHNGAYKKEAFIQIKIWKKYPGFGYAGRSFHLLTSVNSYERCFLVCTGEPCSSSTPLKLEELEKGNCEQLVKGSLENYLTVECKIYRYYQGYYLKQCLAEWCLHIASCFNQTHEWETLCSKKFYWFRSSWFDISATTEVVNVSYVRNIHVKYCGRAYPKWNTVRFKFSLKTTGYTCKSENTNNGKKDFYCVAIERVFFFYATMERGRNIRFEDLWTPINKCPYVWQERPQLRKQPNEPNSKQELVTCVKHR